MRELRENIIKKVDGFTCVVAWVLSLMLIYFGFAYHNNLELLTNITYPVVIVGTVSTVITLLWLSVRIMNMQETITENTRLTQQVLLLTQDLNKVVTYLSEQNDELIELGLNTRKILVKKKGD